MFDKIVQNVQQKIPLTPDQITGFTARLKPKKLRRHQFLLEAGDTSDYLAFVHKGLLRSFMTDDRGAEHVMQFALEDFWMADLYSFITQGPAQLAIEALEESEVLLLSHQHLDELYQEAPPFERFFRLLMQNGYVAAQQRVMAAISASAVEQYQDLIRRYPTLEQRVAQYQIASFLGITPESLSRIKKSLYEGTG